MIKRILNIYKNAYSGLPKSAWTLALVLFFNYSGAMVLFFMTLYLTRKLDFTITQAGRMISVYGMGSLLGAFLGGWMSDILGTKKVQILSLSFTGIGYIVLGHLVTPVTIGIMLFLVASVAEAFRPANASAMAQSCPAEIRPRAFALSRLAVNLGVTIGPALGGFLATINYRYLFYVDGLTCIGAAIFLSIAFDQSRADVDPKHEQESVQGRLPWKDGMFLATLGLLFLMGILFFQIFNTWPLYLREHFGFSEDRIGLLLTINAIMIVLIEMPLIHRLERQNPIKIISLGSLFLFGGFGLLPFGHTYGYVALMVILWTSGEILVFPLITTFIANRSTDQNMGKYMGMFTFTFSLAFVIGPTLGTWIYESWGPTQLWICLGIMGIFVYVGFRIIDRILKNQ